MDYNKGDNMAKTNLDKYIENEIKRDPSLKSRLDEIGRQIEIGVKIYKLRKEKKITQKKLSEITGMKQSNISRLESADYQCSLQTLIKIADALNTTLDYLVSYRKENIFGLQKTELSSGQPKKENFFDFSNDINQSIDTHVNNSSSEEVDYYKQFQCL